jgi:peptidase YpeB-like protein
VAQTCQKSQVRITKNQAIDRAEAQVSFKPTREQVRLLRQGLSSKPFWIVSLSIPRGDGTFRQLAVVRVDANTGKVEDVRVQRPATAK